MDEDYPQITPNNDTVIVSNRHQSQIPLLKTMATMYRSHASAVVNIGSFSLYELGTIELQLRNGIQVKFFVEDISHLKTHIF